MTLLIPEVLAILTIDAIFLIFSFIAAFLSVKIVLKWDINSTSSLQYRLENQSYLVSTIIKYILLLKIPLFLFFVFTMDKLSLVIPGAMCAAGVANATPYGFYLIILKIVNIYLFGFWLLLHKFDISRVDYPFVKAKFIFFLIIFLLLFTEITLEVLMFYGIDPAKIVSCCGTLFSAAKTSSISSLMQLPHPVVVLLFYISFGVMVLFYLLKKDLLFALANLLFLFVSLLSLILFFGTYIYELPTHHCPFCMLQKDYFYIGYILYITLFSGTFWGMAEGFMHFFIRRKIKRWYNLSLLFNSLYLIIISSYPIIFYIKNKVWL